MVGRPTLALQLRVEAAIAVAENSHLTSSRNLVIAGMPHSWRNNTVKSRKYESAGAAEGIGSNFGFTIMPPDAYPTVTGFVI